MNRAKARLKHTLEEYGQRGKLQAELLRLKGLLKGILGELKDATAKRDRMHLDMERKNASKTQEAWGERRSIMPEDGDDSQQQQVRFRSGA